MANTNYRQTIILIAGRSQSGKDTAANIISEYLNKKRITNKITHFADKLKIISHELLSEFDNSIVLNDFYEDKDKHNKFLGTNNRVFLQKFGTIARKHFGENIWAESVDINYYGINIIADYRYLNERLVLERKYPNYNIITIRVNREKSDKIVPTHHSEDLNFKCDINIDNNKSIERLKEQLLNIIDEILECI